MRTFLFLVISLLLIVAPSFAAADQKTPAAREALLPQLHRCLQELAPAVDAPVESQCGGKDVGILSGIQRDTLVEALGEPTWCRAADGLNYLHGPECKSSKQWAWSFYRLPKNWAGGGPELICEIDETGKCSTVKWMGSQ